MVKSEKVLERIIMTVLLICTVIILYSLISNPFGDHSVIFPLVVSAGFVTIGNKEKFKKKSFE
ncbi:hypothetical protein [Clostridium sp. B9]|uniref:hypothetical protein n=1 Tax=Clostridium sp. B9 TaxID=3423224 RepID=UPI003D2EA53C